MDQDVFSQVEIGLRRAAITSSIRVEPRLVGDDDLDWRWRQQDEVAQLVTAAQYNELLYRTEEARELIACLVGENAGPQWLWVVVLASGRVAYARGGCDYTGWDCASDLEWSDADDLHELVGIMTDEERSALAALFDSGRNVGPSSLSRW